MRLLEFRIPCCFNKGERGLKMDLTASVLVGSIALAALATEAPAQNSTTSSFYNSGGASIGRATTSGSTATLYDSGGRVTSRAFTNGNTTTIYDSRGRVIARETRTGNTTTIYDRRP
jgi:YD repeat-containing protein